MDQTLIIAYKFIEYSKLLLLQCITRTTKIKIKFKAYNETWLELQVKAADLSTFNIKLLTNPICILADMNTQCSWQNEIDKTL